ncbi:hypothetical protein OAT10_00105 [Luminiphilus sp.]|nr:hypothetical protein [Luminiphilus sp.]
MANPRKRRLRKTARLEAMRPKPKPVVEKPKPKPVVEKPKPKPKKRQSVTRKNPTGSKVTSTD